MSTSYYDPSYNPEFEPQTPPAAEAKLQAYQAAMDAAVKALADARNAELEAEEARDAAKRRAQLSEECPPVGVFGGKRTTVAFQKAWIEDQIQAEERAYKLAKVARQAASDHLRKLTKQGQFQQSITSSAREAYRGTGSRSW